MFLVVPMLKGCLADLSESVVIKLIGFRQPKCSSFGFLKQCVCVLEEDETTEQRKFSSDWTVIDT